ncbi:38328_t:CDS:2 [Gigaspora margarita]|uniref:38328_t:CDS:1 n=1 Tax=Gigaspora margarita TaxID=4874 RepID=A0ABN7VZ14_GIGMA|nr:38328_t:CDS:2 [Gigaspora margarita]
MLSLSSSLKYTANLIGQRIYFLGSDNFTKFFYLDVSYSFDAINPPFLYLPTKIPNESWSITSIGGFNHTTIFLFGGTNNSYYAIDTNKLDEYNYNYNNVSTVDTINLENFPELRRIGASSVVNPLGQIFIFGGYSIKDNDAFTWYNDTIILDIIDTIKLSWTIYTDAPILRSGHTATLMDDGRILYIGGFDNSFNYVPMDQISIFDTNTSSWNLLTADGSVPSSRSEHSAVLVLQNSEIIIYGGLRQDSTLPPTPTLAVLTYGKTFTWITQIVNRNNGNRPPILHSNNAILVGDLMIVALGNKTESQQILNESDLNIYVLNTTNFTWITTFTPPSLYSNITNIPPDNNSPNM